MAHDQEIEKAARRLCTHTIVFTEPVDQMVVVRAMQGRTTKAIAREFGITAHEAQYRLNKAQKSLKTRFRADYRDGNSKVAQQMLRATETIGMRVVEHDIAPKFIPFARQGVSRRVT